MAADQFYNLKDSPTYEQIGEAVKETNRISVAPALSQDQRAIESECDALKAMLIAKNKQYGSSAFNPIGVFAAPDAQTQIEVRIDDKLKRIQNMRGRVVTDGEDTVLDLIGYLVLWRIEAERKKGP